MSASARELRYFSRAGADQSSALAATAHVHVSEIGDALFAPSVSCVVGNTPALPALDTCSGLSSRRAVHPSLSLMSGGRRPAVNTSCFNFEPIELGYFTFDDTYPDDVLPIESTSISWIDGL